MKIWAMDPEEDSLVGFMPDKRLLRSIATSGANPVAVREVLKAAGLEFVEMQLAKYSANRTLKKHQSIPDLVIWSWIAIFSRRAATAAIECGCEDEEFWPCRFQTNPEEEFFFHLPMKTFDIVDVDKSIFKFFLPLSPPVPMFIEALVTKQLPDHLPPCFRAVIPGRGTVFCELFVRDDFRIAWELSAFRGATFRLLSA